MRQWGLNTQQDPIGIAGGLNLYGYAGGDPVNYSDPFGLCPPKDDANDCATAYWAQRFNGSTSWLGRIGNGVMGTLAACGESRCFAGVLMALGGVSGDQPGLSLEEESLPPLQRIHPDETYETDQIAKGSLRYWRGQSTEDIVNSLKPGQETSLKAKPDGRIMDGNTRTRVLEERD